MLHPQANEQFCAKRWIFANQEQGAEDTSSGGFEKFVCDTSGVLLTFCNNLKKSRQFHYWVRRGVFAVLQNTDHGK